MPTPIVCRLFGAPVVTVDGDALEVDTRKAIGLLALVVVEGVVTREWAASLFWPESPEHRAKAALRRTLSTLTRALAGNGVIADRQQISLVPDDIESDVLTLLAADQSQAEELIGLRRGPFLDGLVVRGAPEFDDWRRDTARQLDRRLLRVIDAAIEEALTASDADRLEALSERRLDIHPAHERTHALRIWLAGRTGDRDLVVARYRQCVTVLNDELGVAPQQRTTDLYEEALEADDLGRLAGPDGRDTTRGVDANAVRSVLALSGQFLPVSVVADAAALSLEEFEAVVDELESAGSASLLGDTIGIVSALDRAEIATALGAVRRQALHRRIADALEGHGGYAATRAVHLSSAGRPDDAARAWRLAWREEAARGAWEQARHHLEEAIAAGHPEQARLMVELADLDARRGRYDEARDTLVSALSQAGPAERGAVELRLGRLQLRRQRWGAAEVHLNAARAAGETAGPELAMAAWHHGSPAKAIELVHEALAEATSSGDRERTIAAHNVLGVLLRRQGNPAEAADHLEAGLELAAGGSAQRCALLNNLGLSWLDAGLHDQAEARLDDALEAARATGDLPAEGAILNSLADLARARGDDATARRLVRESVTRLSLVGANPTAEPETWTLLDW